MNREAFEKIYGPETDAQLKRYGILVENYKKLFSAEDSITLFTSPGRTEIIGNHTDHNGGKILAASVTMDTIGAASKTDDGVIALISEGYDTEFVIDTDKLDDVPKDQGTLSLIGGILAGLVRSGYKIGGFKAYVSTNVASGAGISSSASFEMLVCTMINAFYNDGKIPYEEYALAGQYAENEYWHKGSGLMDQMACAYGGTILLDFSKGVKVERVNFTFDDIGYKEVLINTGKGHADLSEEYSSIPSEMRKVASELNGITLVNCQEENLLNRLNEIRAQVHNDRAILRALHFYEECGRVDEAVQAVKEGKSEKLLSLIAESGHSSYEWLQNAYVTSDYKEQPVPMALALSEIFMKRHGAGVCRLHGGGFGGVIMAVVPADLCQVYKDWMAPYFGRENIYVTGIRKVGAVPVCTLKGSE